MHVKSSGKTYHGIHEPIVPVAVWKRVQAIRSERSGPKTTRHNHLFMGLFRCGLCNKPMVPERQKGHVYYRCKRRACATKTIREELLDDAIRRELGTLELNAQAQVRAQNTDKPEALVDLEEQRSALELRIKDEESRLGRLEDLLIDGTLDRETFARKQRDIQLRLAELRDEVLKLPDVEALAAYQHQLAELRKNLVFLYDMANRAEKRMIVENVWPNRTVSRNEVSFKPYSWVTTVDPDPTLLGGAPERDRDRTSITEDDKLTDPLLNLLVVKKKYHNNLNQAV